MFADGRLEAAESLHHRALVGFKETVGFNHPHTLLAMINLTLTMRARADKVAARLAETPPFPIANVPVETCEDQTRACMAF